jgi:hypothetical protein
MSSGSAHREQARHHRQRSHVIASHDDDSDSINSHRASRRPRNNSDSLTS